MQGTDGRHLLLIIGIRLFAQGSFVEVSSFGFDIQNNIIHEWFAT